MKLSAKERIILESLLDDKPLTLQDKLCLAELLEKDSKNTLTHEDYIGFVMKLYRLYELFQHYLE